jgi:hypothetical protein
MIGIFNNLATGNKTRALSSGKIIRTETLLSLRRTT